MQSENRLFDDAIKGLCKIFGSLCKLKKSLCNIEDQASGSQEKKKD